MRGGIKFIGGPILLAALLLVAPGLTASAQKERAADQAAGKWLALVDAGAWDESWRRAAALFKRQVNAAQWRAAVSAAREPLGSMISRKLVSATYTTRLPGAPDGEYVVLQYQSEFRRKKFALETVTPMLDDGQWRVSGYFIR